MGVVQALYLLGEHRKVRDRCVVFTQWALPKYFTVQRFAPLGRPPPLLGAHQRQVGACGHPTTFHNLSSAQMDSIARAARYDRFWFARKFPPDATVVHGNGKMQGLEEYLIDTMFEFDNAHSVIRSSRR